MYERCGRIDKEKRRCILQHRHHYERYLGLSLSDIGYPNGYLDDGDPWRVSPDVDRIGYPGADYTQSAYFRFVPVTSWESADAPLQRHLGRLCDIAVRDRSPGVPSLDLRFERGSRSIDSLFAPLGILDGYHMFLVEEVLVQYRVPHPPGTVARVRSGPIAGRVNFVGAVPPRIKLFFRGEPFILDETMPPRRPAVGHGLVYLRTSSTISRVALRDPIRFDGGPLHCTRLRLIGSVADSIAIQEGSYTKLELLPYHTIDVVNRSARPLSVRADDETEEVVDDMELHARDAQRAQSRLAGGELHCAHGLHPPHPDLVEGDDRRLRDHRVFVGMSHEFRAPGAWNYHFGPNREYRFRAWRGTGRSRRSTGPVHNHGALALNLDGDVVWLMADEADTVHRRESVGPRTGGHVTHCHFSNIGAVCVGLLRRGLVEPAQRHCYASLNDPVVLRCSHHVRYESSLTLVRDEDGKIRPCDLELPSAFRYWYSDGGPSPFSVAGSRNLSYCVVRCSLSERLRRPLCPNRLIVVELDLVGRPSDLIHGAQWAVSVGGNVGARPRPYSPQTRAVDYPPHSEHDRDRSRRTSS